MAGKEATKTTEAVVWQDGQLSSRSYSLGGWQQHPHIPHLSLQV